MPVALAEPLPAMSAAQQLPAEDHPPQSSADDAAAAPEETEVQPELAKKKKKKNKKKKGKSKPTGFEEYLADGPLTLEQAAEEQLLYNPAKPFAERIEICIQRYKARRKWTPTRLQMFEAYLHLGGIATGQKQFGGVDLKRLTDLDAEEISRATATDYVDRSNEDEWEVDFEYVVRGYLSWKIPYVLCSQRMDDLITAANLARNFLNYVSYHDVAPEYRESINAARKLCDVGEEQLVQCHQVSQKLPGQFNVVCSALFGGAHSGTIFAGGWSAGDIVAEDPYVLERENASAMFTAALRKWGTEQQIKDGLSATVVRRDFMSLEVVDIKRPGHDDPTRNPEDMYFRGLKSLGRIVVKAWIEDDPDEGPVPQPELDEIEILLDKETLAYCFVGMKLEARVHRLSSGINFIDSVTGVFCSFFLRLEDPDRKDGDALDSDGDYA